MTSHRSAPPSPPILWPQVWGLAAVQGAISLTWVIYNLYLLRLLTQYGFSTGFVAGLLIVEAGAAMVMEPIMGSLSDQSQRWVGSRFPFIASGIILASVCFLGIPLTLIAGSPTAATRWLLPTAMVLWALSMTVFRSPVLSLLGRYAIATRQPQAASILTLVGGVAGALAPLAGDAILRVGPLLAFTLGSLAMLGSALVLRFTNPNQSLSSEPAGKPSGRLVLPALAATFASGFSITLGLQLLLTTFPTQLGRLTPQPNLVMGVIYITIVCLAFPAGTLAKRLGAFRAMALGLALLSALCLALIYPGTLGTAVAGAIAVGSGLSLVFNCTIPIALSAVPPHRGGLGTGLYFGGAALAASVFGGFIKNANLGTAALFGTGAIAFLAAIAFIQPIRWAAAQPNKLTSHRSSTT